MKSFEVTLLQVFMPFKVDFLGVPKQYSSLVASCGFQEDRCITAIVDCALLKVYTHHFENLPILNIPVVLDEYMKSNEECTKPHCLQFSHSVITKASKSI